MGWINEWKCKKGMKLDLGSGNPEQGEVQPEGYVLNDVQLHKNIDLVCNIVHVRKFVPDGYCSEVRMSHVLEHFTIKEGVEVIKMVWKILEDNGRFLIYVPNFKWHCELLMTGQDEMAVHYAFGGDLDKYDQHKTAFTPKILKKRLEENGFEVTEITNGTSITCVGLKRSL
jgi:predicted SAM-dependent methyltransferase